MGKGGMVEFYSCPPPPREGRRRQVKEEGRKEEFIKDAKDCQGNLTFFECVKLQDLNIVKRKRK